MVKFRCRIQTNTLERKSPYENLNTVSLESNSQITINFLLLFKRFLLKSELLSLSIVRSKPIPRGSASIRMIG